MKTLDNTSASNLKENVGDVKIVGNGDAFKLISKASSVTEGWLKSTKAYEIINSGCLVQVTTQQRNPDGSYSVAEALTFIPYVKCVQDENGGLKLVSCIQGD